MQLADDHFHASEKFQYQGGQSEKRMLIIFMSGSFCDATREGQNTVARENGFDVAMSNTVLRKIQSL